MGIAPAGVVESSTANRAVTAPERLGGSATILRAYIAGCCVTNGSSAGNGASVEDVRGILY